MLNFSNLRISKKLGVGFGIIILALLIVGFIGFFGIARLENSLGYIGDNRFPDLLALATLNRERMDIRAQTLEVLSLETIADSQDQFSRILDQRRTSFARTDEAMETLGTIPRLTDRGRGLVSDLQGGYREWRNIYVDIDRVIQDLSRTTSEERRAELYTEYRDVVARMIPISDAFGATADELTDNNMTNTRLGLERDIQFAQNMEIISVVISVIGLIIAVFMAIIINKNVSNPLTIGVNLSRAIAEGDLTQNIDNELRNRKDEIGDLAKAMQQMTDSLRNVFTNISDGIETLASSSTELSVVSNQLVSGSNTTSEQVNSIAGAVEQLTTNISTIASAVEEINVNIADVSDNSERISTDTQEISNTMEELNNSMQTVSNNAIKAVKITEGATLKSNNATSVMNELGIAAKEIGKITEVIKKIAEQTNLLALNATIEAASAGEAGKGFAVVAKEIKELAKQSAKAADNISDQIEEIQSKTETAVSTINEVSNTIEDVNDNIKTIDSNVQEQTANSSSIANTIADNTRGIKSISKSISEISSGVSEVSKNIGEGAKGTNMISNDISKVTGIAEDSNKAAQDLQVSAEELSKLAEGLKKDLQRFKI